MLKLHKITFQSNFNISWTLFQETNYCRINRNSFSSVKLFGRNRALNKAFYAISCRATSCMILLYLCKCIGFFLFLQYLLRRVYTARNFFCWVIEPTKNVQGIFDIFVGVYNSFRQYFPKFDINLLRFLFFHFLVFMSKRCLNSDNIIAIENKYTHIALKSKSYTLSKNNFYPFYFYTDSNSFKVQINLWPYFANMIFMCFEIWKIITPVRLQIAESVWKPLIP